MWSPKTTTWCANTRSTGATTPQTSWSCSTSCGGWCRCALNFFTPTKKPVGYTSAADGRRTRIYDQPATPWQRLQAPNVLDTQNLSVVATRVDGINPADPTRQINTIQMQLLDLATAKTETLAAARHIDPAALQPSINRLAKTKNQS
jgi:hypothetical protein